MFLHSVLNLNMSHQTSDKFDFVTENVTQNLKDFSNPKINLLVTKKIHEISSKTSNPKRMTELIVNYMVKGLLRLFFSKRNWSQVSSLDLTSDLILK